MFEVVLHSRELQEFRIYGGGIDLAPRFRPLHK